MKALGETMFREEMRDPGLRTRLDQFHRAFAGSPLSKHLPVLSFSGQEANALFHNRGDGTFEEIGVASGAGRREDGRGVAVADLDRDGRLDLVIANFHRRPMVVLRNQGTGTGAWLGVRLRGTASNRFGVGARVTLTSGDRTWTQEVAAGNGYMSSQPPELHFGLGTVLEVSMRVRWPSGQDQRFDAVGSRSFITVTEGDSELRRDPPRPPAPTAPAAAAFPARAGDALAPVVMEDSEGSSVRLPPVDGTVALVLFSGGCWQCRSEFDQIDQIDARAASLDRTTVLWASIDPDRAAVQKYFDLRGIDRTFVMLEDETRAALLGPGKPSLPVTFVVSKENIEAKFVGADSAVRALTWIGRRQKETDE